MGAAGRGARPRARPPPPRCSGSGTYCMSPRTTSDDPRAARARRGGRARSRRPIRTRRGRSRRRRPTFARRGLTGSRNRSDQSDISRTSSHTDALACKGWDSSQTWRSRAPPMTTSCSRPPPSRPTASPSLEADAADLFFLDLSEAAGSRLIVPMSCDASSRRCVGLDMDDRHLLGSNETLRRAAARMLAGAVDASAAEKIAPPDDDAPPLLLAPPPLDAAAAVRPSPPLLLGLVLLLCVGSAWWCSRQRRRGRRVGRLTVREDEVLGHGCTAPSCSAAASAAGPSR